MNMSVGTTPQILPFSKPQMTELPSNRQPQTTQKSNTAKIVGALGAITALGIFYATHRTGTSTPPPASFGVCPASCSDSRIDLAKLLDFRLGAPPEATQDKICSLNNNDLDILRQGIIPVIANTTANATSHQTTDLFMTFLQQFMPTSSITPQMTQQFAQPRGNPNTPPELARQPSTFEIFTNTSSQSNRTGSAISQNLAEGGHATIDLAAQRFAELSGNSDALLQLCPLPSILKIFMNTCSQSDRTGSEIPQDSADDGISTSNPSTTQLATQRAAASLDAPLDPTEKEPLSINGSTETLQQRVANRATHLAAEQQQLVDGIDNHRRSRHHK